MQTGTRTQCGVHEPDPVSPELELARLQAMLDKPMTEARLSRWLTDIEGRDAFGLARTVASSVWGTIRWPKSIGRPLTPTLASAFFIRHVHWDSKMKITPDGEVTFVDLLAPHPQPSKWDGPHDDDFYRVSFMAETPQRPTRIRVDFAPDVRWEQMRGIHVFGRGYRDISPSERHFIKGETPTVLEAFELALKPYSLVLQP